MSVQDRVAERTRRHARRYTDAYIAEMLRVMATKPRLISRAEKDILLEEAAKRIEQKRVFLG